MSTTAVRHWKRFAILRLCLLVLAGAFILAALRGEAQCQTQGTSRNCVSCHEAFVYRGEFPSSVHGNNGCASCHTIRNVARHTSGEEKPLLINCGSCHGQIAADFKQDAHYLHQSFQCQDCHRDIHALKKISENPKVADARGCTACHGSKEYVDLGHTASVLKGNNDSATCSDCHGVHNTPSFHIGESASVERGRAYYTARCKTCHGNAELVARNSLRPNIVEGYGETYHGKVQRVGYPTQVAGCADCHGGHNILPRDDTRSPVHPGNLTGTCGKCHSKAHPRFANFEAHPDYHDFKGKIALDITYLFMVGLLASVFIFFGIHTLLWWRRAYWQECEMGDRKEPESTSIPGCDQVPHVRRFTSRDRVMHVLLIISFLTLVMTGMPLKYSGAVWAQHLFRLLGGVETAGVLHRAAAAILWGLFLFTCWLSYKFLFPKGQDVKGWVGRLFGPDSLCFNLKDWDDLKGMFRWFFNRGPVPKFDRWTYWEKFDFFAVFWGMTAIGVSGLILWFPEKSSYLMPGWLVSVASLVHSEEALLAALFIFLMHFFHNHIVPGKFPLERNIFTGCNRLEQLKEERPSEYERIMAEGRLESMKCGYPGVWSNLFAGLFGLASVFVGLVLTFLILWAVFFT
jgi:cytochrome b subunit of formate dehydrogenase